MLALLARCKARVAPGNIVDISTFGRVKARAAAIAARRLRWCRSVEMRLSCVPLDTYLLVRAGSARRYGTPLAGVY